MPNKKLSRNIIHMFCLVVALVTIDASRFVQAQQESIHPGINRNFKNPDVEQWLERFEREGREVYTRRDAVVVVHGLKPGMDVADITQGLVFLRCYLAGRLAQMVRFMQSTSPEILSSIMRQRQLAGWKACGGIYTGESAW
jgi:hypothetical protein